MNDIEAFNLHCVLGEEVEISGCFIYDGMRYFRELDIHDPRQNIDIFMSFYNISVGIERLLKVYILLQNPSLAKKVHNFDALLEQIDECNKNDIKLLFNQKEKDFFKVLSAFYKERRYERLTYLDDDMMNTTREFDYIQDCGGDESFVELILNISRNIYSKITEISRENGLFTDGIRPDSNACKILRRNGC